LKNNEWNDQWGVSDLANPFYLKAPGHAASVQLIAAKQQRDAKKNDLDTIPANCDCSSAYSKGWYQNVWGNYKICRHQQNSHLNQST